MDADLYLRNGQIVTSSETFAGGVLVRAGKIMALVRGDPEHDIETIDVHGQIVLPGLVDPHVHFSEPGRGHWEGFASGSRAAAVGGVTTVVEMPLNASPPTIDVTSFEMKRKAAESSVVDYGLWGGLVTDNRSSLSALNVAGVLGFKAFMCSGSADFPRVDAMVLEDGMERIARFGSFLAVHAEDEGMTRTLTANLRKTGRKDARAWGEARPVEAELAAIRSALDLAEKSGARLHIVHVSCAAGVDLITEAKQRGVAVTAETCPHYLYFSRDDFERIGPLAKCAPPLRASADVDALWERVLAGAVDVIASDHSPCLLEEKAVGDADIFEAWGGISGLQSTVQVLITAGLRRGLSWSDIARMTAANPARIVGLGGRKGDIAPGYDADFAIVDPSVSSVLKSADLYYKNKHSAYVGERLEGQVTRTILRGLTIQRGGRMMSGIPAGIFLAGLASNAAETVFRTGG